MLKYSPKWNFHHPMDFPVATRRLNKLIQDICARLAPPAPMTRTRAEKGSHWYSRKRDVVGLCAQWSEWKAETMEVAEEGAALVRFRSFPTGEWSGETQTVDVLLPEQIFPLEPREAAWLGVDIDETDKRGKPPRLYWGTAEDCERIKALSSPYIIFSQQA